MGLIKPPHVPVTNVPLELVPRQAWLTRPVSVSDVKAPVLGVVPPIAAGAAQLFPNNVLASMAPRPLLPRLAPLPTTIAADVLVPLVSPEKAVDPPPEPQGLPVV